ncbi:conserved domain protein [Bacteroides fluxus YIT 12057]|uniref:Conserved domain protein n=1 Tax=Bacteroides fluxus YIT 12057 TaxID=763034 RepID=F3PQH6_9BACE|nr:conserved domain protein [Bacteroides fluxus YIT 12057]
MAIKKRASSYEPLASVRKAKKAFLLICIKFVTQKSIFFFTSKKNKFQLPLLKTTNFNLYLYLITYFLIQIL